METIAHRIRRVLETHHIEASAPCRIDMGGTLDISTFSLPMREHQPVTVNLALDLRTRVRLAPAPKGRVAMASEGLGAADFPSGAAPFTHPLGLMFAVAAYFGVDGVSADITSASPPRSALGGSSVAAVALIGALARAAEEGGQPPMPPEAIASLAHAIESAVAQVPCGIQDQLAAVYGGVNAWHWNDTGTRPVFRREPLMTGAAGERLHHHLIVAYCGVPHESKDINGLWVRRFLAGDTRHEWRAIADTTRDFLEALRDGRIAAAAAAMNRETDLRCRMTPEVLDDMGRRLVAAAVAAGCGARFAGAGGGGCLWALGGAPAVDRLRETWRLLLADRPQARLLDVRVDSRGLLCKVTER